MTTTTAIGGVHGASLPEIKKTLKMLVEVDDYLRQKGLKITSNIIYKKEGAIKIMLDITEIK